MEKFMRLAFIFIAAAMNLNLLMGQVQSAKDALFTSYFQRTQGWTAGDATISIPLPDGRNLWLFGDSYIDFVSVVNNQQRLPCLFQVRNAAMIQTGNRFTTYIDSLKKGAARTLFKLSDNVLSEPVIWPGKGFTHKDTLYVFLYRVDQSGEVIDNYLAKLQLPKLQILSMHPLPFTKSTGINFGVSVLKNSTGDSIYIYGAKKGFLRFDPYLARCHIKDILTKWEYYTGSSWSNTLGNIKKLAGSSNFGVAAHYSVVPHRGKYYIVVQENGFLTCNNGRNIYGFQSSSPFGPFTNRRTLYTMQDTLTGGYMVTYNAEAHPQLADDCTLLVSYNVNGGCKPECNGLAGSITADGYRPKFVRVPWSVLDPALKTCTTSLNDNQALPDVSIYPNPSDASFYLNASAQEVFLFTVTDVQGRIVVPIQKSNWEGSAAFELTNNGLYLLKITFGKTTLTKKIILQK